MLTTIDEVLDIVHRTGPDLVGGNSNHGPMAAEALFALGRPDAVLPWLEGYKSRFQAPPQSRNPISPGDWQASLGDRSRGADWVVFFDRELAEASWQACAAIYAWYSTTPPLAPSHLTPPAEDLETLIDRAVAAGGAHTIKFTEACLREYALHPNPVYLMAAHDAAERVGSV